MLFHQNNNFEQTQFWAVGVASLRFYLDLWRGMLCKIENDFYLLVDFHCEYLKTQKLRNLAFYIKQHVLAGTVLKSRCRHSEISSSVIETDVALDRKWLLFTSFVWVRIYFLWHTQFESSEYFKCSNLNIKLQEMYQEFFYK